MNKFIFSIVILLLSLSLSAQESPSADNNVFTTAQVDYIPEFPDGITAFNKACYMNFRIPELDKKGSHKIYTSFIVEKDGSMSNVRVTKKVDDKLGQEAIRVLQSVKKKWEPAIKNGNPVRYAYDFVITINIS